MVGPRQSLSHWRITILLLCGVAVPACSPMVHVVAEHQTAAASAPDDRVGVVARVRTDGIVVSITNRSTTPIDVLWQKTVLVDTNDHSASVVHSGDRALSLDTTIDGAEDISRIPPGANLEEVVIPRLRVVFDPYYGWVVEPLLPVECGPVRCTGYHELVGKTVRLILTLRVDGEEQVVDRTYLITDTVKSMRGARAEDLTVQ